MDKQLDRRYIIDNGGRIPPSAIDLEEAVLGALMIDNSAIEKIDIKPEFFYKESNQKIFAAIYELHNLNEPIDILTVTEKLRVKGELEEVGGGYFVTLLTNKVANSAHIEFHAKIVTQKYVQREIIRICNEGQKQAFDDSNDPDDILNYVQSSFDTLDNFGSEEPRSWSEVLKESLFNAEKRQKLFLQNKTIGIPTPVYKLTKWTCGWQGGQFIIFAARPGMGKTALGLAILRTAAMHGFSPALFTLEMSDTSLADRLIVGESGIDKDNYRMGKIEPYEWEKLNNAHNKLANLKITIDDKPKSINKICSMAKLLHRKGKCDIALIDYIQLAEDDTTKSNANREQEISRISRKLKLLSISLGIPVIAFSQLNREVEKRPGKTPILSDLRESGSLEQDADMVVFINRPEKYGILEDEEGNSLKGVIYLIIEKQREGQTGTILARVNESLTAVYDYDQVLESKIPQETKFVNTNEVDINNRIEPNRNFDNETDVPF